MRTRNINLINKIDKCHIFDTTKYFKKIYCTSRLPYSTFYMTNEGHRYLLKPMECETIDLKMIVTYIKKSNEIKIIAINNKG